MTARTRDRFGQLSQEQRGALAEYLTARDEYLQASRTYNELLIEELQNPSRSGNRQLRKFESDVLGPARTHMKGLQVTLLTEAVDTDALAELLPQLLAGLARSVNIPLLFAALNIDSDMAEKMVERSATFVASVRAEGESA